MRVLAASAFEDVVDEVVPDLDEGAALWRHRVQRIPKASSSLHTWALRTRVPSGQTVILRVSAAGDAGGQRQPAVVESNAP